MSHTGFCVPITKITTQSLSWLILLGCLAVSPAQAFDWNPFSKKKYDVIIHKPFLNMRSGPGRGFPIFHVAEKGDVVRLLKRRNDWYKVRTEKDVIGWIKRDQLNGAITTDGELVSFTEAGWAEYVNRGWEMGLMAGDFSGADSFTIFGGYHFTPNLGAEVKYTNSFGEFSTTELYSINLTAQPFDTWRVSPFFTLGTGQMKIKPTSSLVQTEDRDEGVMTVGGGLLFYFTRRFVWRAEYNNHTVLTNRPENEEVHEWKAGFSVFY